MHSVFEEFNLLLYHSVVNTFLDAVIWCLGPYVDDSREYGTARLYLAAITKRVVGIWLASRIDAGDAAR